MLEQLDDKYLEEANVPNELVSEALPPGIKAVRVPISSLVLDPKNARQGDVSGIAESIGELGVHRFAVVRRATRELIIGNHMIKALVARGETHVDVMFVTDDEVTAMRRSLADNLTGDAATWNIPRLALNTELTGLDVPGMTDSLEKKIRQELGGVKPDKEFAPEKPVYPIVPEVGENHGCVVIVYRTDTEWAFLRTVLELQSSQSYKCGATGVPHVVSVGHFSKVWKSYAEANGVDTGEMEVSDEPDSVES